MLHILQMSLFVTTIMLATLSTQGAETVNLKIGDLAPNWADLPGVDNKTYGSEQFAKHSVLVVAFTCNSCPYAADYEDRLMAFTKQHCGEGKSVAFVAINANKVEEDRLPKMQERAEKKGFNFPYVYDETQAVARSFGALYTPEFFVFNAERKLVYRGAFDDNSQLQAVKKHYLTDAVTATLAGEKVAVPETPAVGCAVRYERTRRTKS
jgi:peroxiredoxin